MKKIFLMVLSFAVIAGISGCSKSKSDSPSDVFRKLHSVEKPDDAKKYFTKGTLKAMDELKKVVPESEGRKEDKNFNKEDKWEIVKEEIKNEKAVLTVKYLASKDKTKKDQIVPFNFSREESEWKLDYEKEFNDAVQLMKGMKGMMNQMNDMLKSLKK